MVEHEFAFDWQREKKEKDLPSWEGGGMVTTSFFDQGVLIGRKRVASVPMSNLSAGRGERESICYC